MEMMKGEQSNVRTVDLSIGDWVQARMVKWDYDDLDITPPMQVVEIKGDGVVLGLGSTYHPTFVEDLAPIPITREILVKNWWRPPREGVAFDTYFWTNRKDRAIEISEIDGKFYMSVIEQIDGWQRNYHIGCGLQFVHELQRAINLVKIEKEITL